MRAENLRRIIVAVPTAAQEICESFQGEVDEIICAFTPRPFMGVGLWYSDFSQTSDEDVRTLLHDMARLQPVAEEIEHG
jgi:putative phosphoribosyl transferase